jgi:hypothetical protein
MYCAKIKEDLIPKRFQLKEKTGKPMTQRVDQMLREGILLRQLWLTEDLTPYHTEDKDEHRID